MKKILFYILITTVFSSCTINTTTLKNKKHSTEAIQYFWNKEYDKTVDFFDTSEVPDSILDSAISDFKITLDNIRESIVNDFGNTIDFKYINSRKTYSSKEDKNISIVTIQISNKNYYGNIELDYNDNNGLINSIRFMDLKEKRPSLTQFWLLGIYPLFLLLFQIWTIRKVFKSMLKVKWLKLFPIVLLNFPTINIPNIEKVNWEYNFQILLGIGFDYNGLSHLSWTLSIPIGSILILFIYRKKLFKTSPNITS